MRIVPRNHGMSSDERRLKALIDRIARGDRMLQGSIEGVECFDVRTSFHVREALNERGVGEAHHLGCVGFSGILTATTRIE